ncbi:putative quinol monooxygenase [Hyphomonas sp.]|uniref:putative quinol monooxygenase n=1 Tax=Hyphomonas sp. TaxID=87 RepID=UPI0034A05A7B
MLVIGHVTASPETAAWITRLCAEHSACPRTEPGCIARNMHADCANPARLVVVESWADMAALRAHVAAADTNTFVREMRALSPAPTEMNIFSASEIRP